MSNALAVLAPPTEGGPLDTIWQEQPYDDDAFDMVPTKLTVAGSGAQAFQTEDGEMIAAPIAGVVIDSLKIRAYWPQKGEKGGDKVPFCSSPGARVGHLRDGEIPGDQWQAAVNAHPSYIHPAVRMIDASEAPPASGFACKQCPLSMFGSAQGDGRGQACSEKRRLIVLIDGWGMPALLTLPTMSIRGWDSYCSRLLAKERAPFYGAHTKFSIQKVENANGDPYGVVVPTLDAKIGDEQVARAIMQLRAEFRDWLRSQAIEAEPNAEDVPF